MERLDEGVTLGEGVFVCILDSVPVLLISGERVSELIDVELRETKGERVNDSKPLADFEPFAVTDPHELDEGLEEYDGDNDVRGDALLQPDDVIVDEKSGDKDEVLLKSGDTDDSGEFVESAVMVTI